MDVEGFGDGEDDLGGQLDERSQRVSKGHAVPDGQEIGLGVATARRDRLTFCRGRRRRRGRE